MAAGSIVVDLLLKSGSFESDTARARKSLKKLEQDAQLIGRAIGAAFVGAAAGLTYLIKSAIDSQDHLNDLSQATGIAADTLGGIGFAAQQAGGDLDSVAAAAGKLNRSIAEAAAGNKLAVEAFDALGVSVKDAAGNTKTADVVMVELAERFASFADGPEKAALAVRLFGKAGADIIPLLNGGGRALQDNIEYFKRYSGVTQESARQADEFNDTLTKLKLLSGAFGNTLAAELLPSLRALSALLLENKERGDQFRGVAQDLANVIKGLGVFAAYTAGTFVTTADQLGALVARGAALARLDFTAFNNIGKDAADNLLQARRRFEEFSNAINSGQTGGERSAGGGRGFVNPTFVVPDRPNAPRLSGGPTGGSRRGRAGSADDPLAEAKRYLDSLQRQIEKTRELSTVEQVLTDIQAGRIKGIDAATAGKALDLAAQIDQAKQFEEQNKRLKESLDALVDADRERIRQIVDVQKAAAQETDSLGESNARYREQNEEIGATVETLYLIERARISSTIAVKEAALAEAQATDVTGLLSQELEKQIQLLRERLGLVGQREAFERFAEQQDEMTRRAIETNEVFKSAFEDSFAGFLDGTKSAKEAFKDFANSVIADLARIAARQAAEQIFGQAGGSFGGTGSTEGWLGSFVSWLGSFGRASGGPVIANKTYMVGERGPELFVPKQSGGIVPNNRLRDLPEDVLARAEEWRERLPRFISFGGARAAGGPVTQNKTYIVGEKGPEWFVPGRARDALRVDDERFPRFALPEVVPVALKTTSDVLRAPLPFLIPRGQAEQIIPRSGIEKDKARTAEIAKVLRVEANLPSLLGSFGSLNLKPEIAGPSVVLKNLLPETLLASWFGRAWGGARATGGPVSSNKIYRVGERGPELFIPKQSGSIVPNHRLRKIEEDEEVLKLRTSRPRALEKLVSRLGPFGGARADGVTPSKVYVVGEKSPEWFVPAALKAQDVFRQDSAKRQAEQIFYTRNVPLKSPGLVSSLGRAPSVPVELKFNDLEVRVEEGREKLIPPRLFGGVRAGPVVYTAGESEPVLIPQQIPQQLGVPTLKDWSVDALKGPTDVLAARSVAPQLVPSKMELGKMEMVGLKGSELLVERNSENEKLRETNNSILRTFRSEQKVREVWRENLSWPGSFKGAKDGSVVSNETSIVGEKGPELFVSKQDHLKEVLRSNDAMSLMRSDAIVTNNLREVMATTDVLRERENRLERLYQPLQPHIKGPLPSGASTSSKAETGWFVPKVPKASEVLKTSSLTQIVGAQGPDLFAPERSVVTNHRLQTEEVLKARTTAPVLDERLGNLVSRLGGVLDDARTAGGSITASNQKDSVSTVTAGQVKHAEQIIISAKSIVPRLKTDEAWRDELVALLGRFGGSRVTGGPVAASKPYLVGGRELFVAAGENSVVSNTIQSNLAMPKWFDDLLVSWGGARAAGGPVTTNKAYMVGERGREMFVPGQSGTIVPNHKLGGGVTKTYHINVTQPQGASRETGSQFGAAIARRLAIEDSRNN